MSERTISSPPNGSVLEMAPGEVLSVLLPELGGGYRWLPVLPSDVVILDEDRTEVPAPSSVGGAVTRVFRLRAKTPGTAAVSFLLRRSWEKDEPPQAEHHLTLVVHQ